MEFGKLEDISNVDWALPPDDPHNERRISGKENHRLFFGSPAWGCRQWLGKIYPPKTQPEKFLYHYSRNFNSIELNTTHYRIPDENTVNEWLSFVPSGFEFCPKVTKEISHSQFGITDKFLLKKWISFLEKMNSHLGPCFIQFHESFSYENKMLLFRFLENWPSEFELAVEFRHRSWFRDHKILPALCDYLANKKIGLVITDVAGRRDVLHTSLSTPWTMIRLIGNDLDPSDERRLLDWAQRLKEWQKLGLERTYFFIHQPDDLWTIEFAQAASRIFTNEGYLNLPPFNFAKPHDLLSYLEEKSCL